MLGLLALIFGGFAMVFRRRVAANIQRMNLELPVELRTGTAAPVTRPAVTASAPVAARSAAPAPAGALPVLHFMLVYDVDADFVQRRAQFRDEHLALAWKAVDAGELQLGGVLEEGAGKAFLLFRGTRSAAERFAQADPYVRHGLVKQWRVLQWHTTVGEGAALPLRPRAGRPNA